MGNCGTKKQLGVINIGISSFYEALEKQSARAAQVDWRPPFRPCGETEALLDICTAGRLGKKIDEANETAVDHIVDSDPVWVDILPAGDAVEGLDDYTVIHSGPPVAYDDMVMLHQRGMVSACLFEGWAADGAEAERLLKSGKIRMLSALDTNTVGAGTGIITKSVAMMVVEDRASGKRAATFPAEGPFEGGFCGWGVYSPEIGGNLRLMRQYLLPPMRELVHRLGGLPLKQILAESMQMGDENHTRQYAAGLLFEHRIMQALVKLDLPGEQLMETMRYIMDTPRFFHCYGQGASRSAMLSNVGLPYSTMVTAVCGNGVEFGIKVAATGDRWFTAPAPMMEGKYTSSRFSKKDQIPWIGDSCVVECAGLGGMAAAASPIVCNLRGMNLQESIAQTREMARICIGKNHNYAIPNLDFDFLPVGIDVRRVLRTGIAPIIHGGMFNYSGGLIGAGMARVPMECFKKAMAAFAEKYGREGAEA